MLKMKIQYFILFFIILLLWILSDSNSTSKAIYYTPVIVFTIAIIYYLYGNKKQEQSLYYVMGSLFFIMGIIIFLYHFFQASTVSIPIINSFSWLFLVLMLILFMAVVAPYIKLWAIERSQFASVIINFILFIPCLLRDFMDRIRVEWGLTSSTTLILLMAEIVLVVFYFFIPQIYKKWIQWRYGETGLMIGPDLMDRSNMDHRILKQNNYFHSHPLSNYTVSFWFFQNENPERHTIINYGNYPKIDIQNNRAIISYNPQITPTPETEFLFPIQKWNQIVVVYKKDICNIYLNGELQKSVLISEINENRIWGQVTIGQQNRYGNGAISFYRAYRYPMGPLSIKTRYTQQKMANYFTYIPKPII